MGQRRWSIYIFIYLLELNISCKQEGSYTLSNFPHPVHRKRIYAARASKLFQAIPIVSRNVCLNKPSIY